MSQRQDHASVPREMPMDIINEIFESLRVSHQNPLVSNPETAVESLRWIPEATHVCHSWRTAALSTRSLWRKINLVASIPWAFEFARRSGGAPICIIIQPSRDGVRHPKFYDSLKTLVHENVQRIQRMEFRLLDDTEKALLRSVLSNDARAEPALYSILEDLKVTLGSSYSLGPFLLTNDMLRAPELKRLSLGSCIISLNSGPFQNLSLLSVSLKPSFDVVDHLHQMLLRMPNLEELLLFLDSHWTFYLPICGRAVGIQPAILPNLRHIEVRGWDIEWISAILQDIACGPQRRLLISPDQYRGVDQLLSLFTHIMLHTTDASIRRLQLTIYPGSLIGLWLNAWQDDLKSSVPVIGLATPLCSHEVFMSRAKVEFGIVELLDGLLHRTNYQDLQALDLDMAEVLPSSTWVRLFGSLPSLASIEVAWGERELFGALVDGIGDVRTHSEDTNSSAPVVPFRGLKEIKVSRRSEVYTEEELDFMLKCLRKRVDHGMGLKKLIFYFRNSDESDPSLSDLKLQLNAFNELVEVAFEFDEIN